VHVSPRLDKDAPCGCFKSWLRGRNALCDARFACRWGRQPIEDAIVAVQQSLVSVLMDGGARLRPAFQRDVLLEASRDANLGVIWLLSSCAADFSRSNYDQVLVILLQYTAHAPCAV
jgi:hypothetical protein